MRTVFEIIGLGICMYFIFYQQLMELKAQGLKAYFKNLVNFCINLTRLDKITANSPSKSHILHSECVSAALCGVPILSFARGRGGLLCVRPAW